MRAVEDRFTDIQDQLTVLEDGRGGMPGFRGRYTTVEIEAVGHYTREVLCLASQGSPN